MVSINPDKSEEKLKDSSPEPIPEQTKELTETPIPGPLVIHSELCPSDRTILRILLVSGQKTDISTLPTDTVDQFCLAVFESWPYGTISNI